MFITRIVLILSLLTTQVYPSAASAPLPSDPRVIAFFKAVDEAIKTGNTKELDAMLKINEYLINVTDVQGNTALSKAQKAGKISIANYLISKGALPPYPEDEDVPPPP